MATTILSKAFGGGKKKAAATTPAAEQKGPIIAPLTGATLSPELRRRLGKAQGSVGSTGLPSINSTTRLGA